MNNLIYVRRFQQIACLGIDSVNTGRDSEISQLHFAAVPSFIANSVPNPADVLKFPMSAWTNLGIQLVK